MSFTDERMNDINEAVLGFRYSSWELQFPNPLALHRAIESAATAPLLEQIKELERRLDAWKSALTQTMPDDFKDWHENADSELPEIAAFVVSNLRERNAELERQLEQAQNIVAAARNLVKVKGRYHSEQAYKTLDAAISKESKL
jgi:hypothetical protein